MGKTVKRNSEINEYTPLLVIAGPMFLELFLGTMLNNIDTLMLSHYDEYAVGAVGNANQIMFMLNILFNIIATATGVVVAQYLGAKQYDKMNMIYTLAVVFNATFGVVLSLGIVLANPLFMTMLKVSSEMRPYAMTYIYIVGGGSFLMAIYNVLMQILRCNGYPKVGMYISLAINVINIGGNYLFLYGGLKHLNMGVAGVAISTVAARIIAVIAAFVFFYGAKIGKIALKYIRPFPYNLLWKMVKIGLPSAGENLSYTLYQMCLLSFVNGMGNDSVNARVYCNALISFAMIFSNSSAMATQIITGHLVGAGKEDIAYKRVFKTLLTSMHITIALATINRILCPYTLRIFTQNEAIIALGCSIMFVDIFVEIGRCLNMTFICSLKAAGAYIFPLIVGLITMWGLGLTCGYTFGVLLGIGVAGVFMGTATDECIRGLIVMYYWYRKKWYGKSVVDKKAQSEE
ncbi:MAG: MATE family efflux transporter [Lachnospiraceae bacterium]|nr:MATE family efflux transporter [Lachnospiraceae bacterium]